MRKLFLAICLTLACWPLPAGAADERQPIPEVNVWPAVFEPALRLTREVQRSDLAFASPDLGPGERHSLPPLTVIERKELDSPDAKEDGFQTLRLKVGISREITPPVRMALSFVNSPPAAVLGSFAGGLLRRGPDGRLTWTTGFRSPGATAVRLFFEEGVLPLGAQIHIYSASGEIHGPYDFGGGFPAEGFWTHTVFAEEVFVEVQLDEPPIPGPAGPFRLVISRLAHLERLSAPEPLSIRGTSCFVDASCVSASSFPSIDVASKAVAQLIFQSGGSFYACSGALMNDTAGSFTPYLLTAHHCFGDQLAASSLQATWRFKTSSCGGVFPPENQFPSSLGATLLATSTISDFTFVRLNQSPPAGSYYLGWTTTDYSTAGGTRIYRVSHPAPSGLPWPQAYSSHSVESTPFPSVCSPQGNFIYSTDVQGGVAEGSSGSPVYLSDGRVIGQLQAHCGLDLQDDCDSQLNSTVDGAFRFTYPSVAQWLNPVSGTAPLASFSFSPPSPVVGQTVSFTDTSTGAPTSWSWNLGDGTSTTAQNPTKTFSTAGNYTVSLTASNSFGSSSSSHMVTVGPAALPNLTPYQPSGWSAQIVVARAPGQLVDSPALAPTDTLYVSWAVANAGTAPTQASFLTELYVDGRLSQTWRTDPPLNPNFYTHVNDFSIGFLPAGTHTLRIKTGSANAIAESNETDNEFTKSFAIGANHTCSGCARVVPFRTVRP
jgi:hypothetical protein